MESRPPPVPFLNSTVTVSSPCRQCLTTVKLASLKSHINTIRECCILNSYELANAVHIIYEASI